MKTKREWLASAVILLGSGSILSAAALATTPSPQQPAAASNAKPAQATPTQRASLAASIASATTTTAVVPTVPNVTTEAVQAEAEESAVQVVTGDLKQNELYIFADNEKIPEKILDEHPDAAMAVLGADEKTAAEKQESFNKTAKIVAERREKARIVAAIQAEADNQTLREWRGGQVTLSYDRSMSHEKSALAIQQHLYPRYTQLANLPEIKLSDSDAVVVQREMQKQMAAEKVEDHQQDNDPSVHQTLSMMDFDKMAHHLKITLPTYRGVHQRNTKLTEMFAAKGALAANGQASQANTSDVHTAHVTVVLEKNIQKIHSETIATLAMNSKLLVPARTLHRYVFRLPTYLHTTAIVPAVEVATMNASVPVHQSVEKSETKHEQVAPIVASSSGKLVLPFQALHRYALHLPEHLNMTAINAPVGVAGIPEMKGKTKVVERPAIHAASSAIVQAAMMAKAIEVASVKRSHVGVIGTAFEGAHLAMRSARQPSALSVANQLHRKSIQMADTLNVALLAPSVHIERVAKSHDAPVPSIKLAERVPVVIHPSNTGNAKASGKFATAAKFDNIKQTAIKSGPSHKAFIMTSMKSVSVKHHAISPAPLPRAVVAMKTVKAPSVTKEMSKQKYKAKPRSRYVAVTHPTVKPVVAAVNHAPRHHYGVNRAAQEHALTALERQLAAEPAPVFHPRRVATRRVDEPREFEQDGIVEEYPAYHQQAAAATDDSPRVQRHHRARPTEYDVASLDGSDEGKQSAKRYRKWNNPAEFSKMMME